MKWRRQTNEHTRAGNLKQRTRQDVINWASVAWSDIPEKIIIKSFLRCGISNKLDGSEDDQIREDIPKDTGSDSEDEEEASEDEEDGDTDDLDPFGDVED